MESIADIFGRRRTIVRGKPLSERAELVRYFSEKLDRSPKHIGIRLSHYTLSDLYALQSAYKDRLERNGITTAQKYFWWITKTK